MTVTDPWIETGHWQPTSDECREVSRAESTLSEPAAALQQEAAGSLGGEGPRSQVEPEVLLLNMIRSSSPKEGKNDRSFWVRNDRISRRLAGQWPAWIPPPYSAGPELRRHVRLLSSPS